MRKYFVFNIKDELYKVYKLNPYGLYKTLENLYTLKEIKYEVTLFNNVCNLIDNDVIKYYVEHCFIYKKNHNKYLISNFIMEINKSCVVVESNYNLPYIFNSLNIYSKKMLVIDFYNNDYFWLNEYL